ncbi:MAG: aminotransferase class V-fold PLP-dependent enzyme [SAR324 cluster bacterium]|nr:aminotransferase class V-fold PLP-dependent enzyme [SAR324 cluster bacterium]
MIENQKHLFKIPDHITYLNCSYLSPQLRSVSEAGHQGVAFKESPWELYPENFFTTSEDARRLFAELVDGNTDDVAIIPSASYGISVAARNMKVAAGEKIIVLEDQFPSNVYPWNLLAKEKKAIFQTVRRPDDGDWTAAVIEAMDEKTAVVALAHCHWTDGSLIDLIKVREFCDRYNSSMVIDGTQSLGAMPFSVKEIRPDFLIGAAYKWLLGPYSLGFLYANPDYHEGDPIEYNWINRKNSEDFSGLVNYRDEYQPGARRFDVGERSNFALMPMVVAALKQILAWKVREIEASLTVLTNYAACEAEKLQMTVAPPHLRSKHMLGIRFSDGVPEGVVKQLADNHIYVSVRGSSIRISPHLYNSEGDIDRLFEVLKK